MLITRKLVWTKLAKHLANVFSAAMTITTVKLLVSQLLRRSTRNALARFDIKTYSKISKLFCRKIVHLAAHVTIMTVICPRKKRLWHCILEVPQLHQFLFIQTVRVKPKRG